MNTRLDDAGHNCARCLGPLELVIGDTEDDRRTGVAASARCPVCDRSWVHLDTTAGIRAAVAAVVARRTSGGTR